jgi:ABC-type glycerol-3-phosphate transport system substrate-binding protein
VEPQHTVHRWLAESVLLVLLLASLGCAELASTWFGAPPPSGPALPTRGSTPLPDTPVLPPASFSPHAVTNLTLWIAVEHAPEGEMLTIETQKFEDVFPDIRVQVESKSLRGAGGIEDILLAAAPVAPSALPDIAIVSAAQVELLTRLRLIRPWHSLVPPDSLEDFLPLAQRMGMIEGEQMGVPLTLDIQHMAYNVGEFGMSPPTWRDLLNARSLYAFPTTGTGEAVDTLLVQYLGTGGRLVDEDNLPLLEEPPLLAALGRYQGAQIAGIIAPEALQLDNLTGCWSLYLSHQVGVTHVWASSYLATKSMVRQTSYAAIPTGPQEAIAAIGRARLMVLLAEDPVRQERAARLLTWLLSPQQNTSLCRAMSWLPPSRAAFARWQDRDDPYHAFLLTQLETALPQPTLPALWKDALSVAIDDVLHGEQTAREATTHVMATIAK